MIIQAKFKLVKTLDRHVHHKFDGEHGLVEQVLTMNCFMLEKEEFESVSDADHFRSLKDYPEDYLILQIW
jgi:hypothetical protein